MDIANIRFLLSALIAALPTVMTLGLIAVAAFPRDKAEWIKNTELYNKSICGIIILFSLFITAVLINMSNLATLDSIFAIQDYRMFMVGIMISVASLVATPIFIFWYLIRTANL